MHENCSSCSRDWQKRYELAVKSFNKQLKKAVAVSIVAVCGLVFCVVIMAWCVAQMQQFIAQFEYVEETCYEIQQDDGTNTAVIGEGNEVKVYGESNNSCRADDQKNNSEILEKKGAING